MPGGLLMVTDLSAAFKTCSICHVEKPVSEYYRRSKSADGLQRACRPCSRAALDAATARRRLLRRTGKPIATTWDELDALLVVRAAEVAAALVDYVPEGIDSYTA